MGDIWGSTTKAHHRIVRIPPGESVVLNSAERAPYLIILEILHDDLDFDPLKLRNKEILGRSQVNQRTSALTENFAEQRAAFKEIYKMPADGDNLYCSDQGTPEMELNLSKLEEVAFDGPNDEIDIVEQVYGTKLSVHQAPDFTNEILLPLPRKNRELDVATWSKAPHRPVSVQSNNVITDPSSWSIFFNAGSGSRDSKRSIYTPVVSLDDYSERMRTAAIMLAQLNAFSMTEISRNPILTIRGLIPTDFISESPFGWLLKGHTVATESAIKAVVPAVTDATTEATLENQSDMSRSSRENPNQFKVRPSEAAMIRDRIMGEMLALEEERVLRMRDMEISDEQFTSSYGHNTVSEDEIIVRREIKRSDPSAAVFKEPWAKKKVRVFRYSGNGVRYFLVLI